MAWVFNSPSYECIDLFYFVQWHHTQKPVIFFLPTAIIFVNLTDKTDLKNEKRTPWCTSIAHKYSLVDGGLRLFPLPFQTRKCVRGVSCTGWTTWSISSSPLEYISLTKDSKKLKPVSTSKESSSDLLGCLTMLIVKREGP